MSDTTSKTITKAKVTLEVELDIYGDYDGDVLNLVNLNKAVRKVKDFVDIKKTLVSKEVIEQKNKVAIQWDVRLQNRIDKAIESSNLKVASGRNSYGFLYFYPELGPCQKPSSYSYLNKIKKQSTPTISDPTPKFMLSKGYGEGFGPKYDRYVIPYYMDVPLNKSVHVYDGNGQIQYHGYSGYYANKTEIKPNKRFKDFLSKIDSFDVQNNTLDVGKIKLFEIALNKSDRRIYITVSDALDRLLKMWGLAETGLSGTVDLGLHTSNKAKWSTDLVKLFDFVDEIKSAFVLGTYQ